MEIHERVVGNVTVLDLQGKLAISDGSGLLREKVGSLAHQGRTLLVLNLAAVPYVDSAGLGEIVRSHATVVREGGAVRLLNADKRVRDLLSITKLTTVFDVFDNESQAVTSAWPARVATTG